MPPVVALLPVIIGTVLELGPLATALLSTVISVGIGFVARALAPKPKAQDQNPISSGGARTAMIRQAVAPRRWVIGEVRLGGILTYYSSDAKKTFHHMVVTFCDGPIDGMPVIWFDDQPIYADQINGAGLVTAGPFNGKARIKKYLGDPGQAADPDLLAECPELDANFRGRGIAYAYVRIEWNPETFPSGLPSVSAELRGAKLYDPRAAATAFTLNGALALRGFLANATFGLGEANGALPDSYFNAAANQADEIVAAAAVSHGVQNVDPATDIISLAEPKLAFQTGDQVQVATTGVLPAGIAALTNYYVIVVRSRARTQAPEWKVGYAPILASEKPIGEYVQIKLATTYANTVAGIPRDITDAGSGTHTVTKTGEPRYTVSGVITADQTASQALDDLVRAMAGRAVNAGGVWRVQAGGYVAPTVPAIVADDIIAPIKVQTRISLRDRFNRIKGKYYSPLNDWSPDDYPLVISTAYEAQDGGGIILKSHDLPLTTRAQTAQRLARIEMRRMRFETTVELVCNLKALALQAADTAALTLADYGWTAKVFEVTSWRLVVVKDKAGRDMIGVSLTLRETDPSIFEFSYATDESLVSPKARSNLPSAFSVLPPGPPVVSEALYQGRDGSDVKGQVSLIWPASDDALVTDYELNYKLASASAWTARPVVNATITTDVIFDITPGIYDFRVRAINWLGKNSDWSPTTTRELFGLNAAPVVVTGLTISINGGLATLRWDQHPDLDVRRGGHIEFRWSPLTAGATVAESTSIGNAVEGKETTANLPARAGTYFAIAIDKLGNPSLTAASIVSSGATALGWSSAGSVVEDPAFAGTHSGTAKAGSVLTLDGASLIDSWGLVDDIVDWDTEGGIVATGTYTFSAGIDLGSVQRIRWRAHLRCTTVNVRDKIDSRAGNIDDWLDFDGAIAPGASDAQVWFRSTQDNPAGSPVWTTWYRLDVAEDSARAAQFQARLYSTDTAYRPEVSELRAYAETTP